MSNYDAARQVLAKLHRTYDFGPVLNKQIDALLKETRNPLLAPPAFLGNNKHDLPLLIQRYDGDAECIHAGQAHLFSVMIFHHRADNSVTLKVGCRRFKSAVQARRHWQGNKSRETGEPRPHATALIDWTASVCRFHGWRW